MATAPRHRPGAIPAWFVEPSLGRRFWGAVIDTVILLPTSLLYLLSRGTVAVICVVGIHAAYQVVLTSRTGQTLGKILMGTRVVDAVDGTTISPVRALLRWLVAGAFLTVLALMFPDVGFGGGFYTIALGLSVLPGPLHLGFHDTAAGTVVTSVGAQPAAAGVGVSQTDDAIRAHPLRDGVALSLVTVGLVVAAFPPVGLWPAIWVAFVPMLVAQHRVLPPRWSGLGPAVGIGGMFGFHLSPGLVDGGLPVLAVVWPALMAAVMAPLFWRSRRFHESTSYRWFLVSAPVAWVALDFLRTLANEVFAATFGYPSYAMWDHPALLQPISVFGINGLELLVFVANWAVGAGVIALIDRRRGTAGRIVLPLRAGVGLAVAGALVVAWLGTSAALLDDPAPTVRVAAVQSGVDRDDDASEERYRRDREQTRDAAAQGAQLVVWNEKGLGFDPREERTDELRALVAETGVHLVIGFGFEDDEGRHHNEVTLLSPDGEFLGVYGKDHPGTFAGDFSDTGGTYPVYDTALGPISTIICYDLDFTDTARHMARGGARLVATPSADVPSIGQIHFTHLVFRAIENRVAMVKADNEFDSVIIDPYGRILAKVATSEGGRQATLVATVPLGSGTSPWVELGDWLGWLCVAGTWVLVVGAWRVRREPRGRAD